jgi:enamine deaminase RidA (YjgF/YER057c/UK114 family)
MSDRSVRRLSGDPPSPWETEYGYSRVVIAGGLVLVGGMTAVGPLGGVVGETPYQQTREILRKILHELSRAGAMAEDVLALRVYATDISRGEEVGRAFAEVFTEVAPLMTMVEVSALVDPRMWVEIEATALAPGAG